jgi:hypothetical protein
LRRGLNTATTPTQFIAASSLMIEKTIELFDRVMLTPEEESIIEALQIIKLSIDNKKRASIKLTLNLD